MKEDLASGFKEVDRATNFAAFSSCLELIDSIPFFAELKRESHRLAGAAPGRRILDVGCGLGDDAAALAGRVAPGGTVVGVDGSQAMLAEARRRHGGGENLSFELANAAHLRTQRAGRMSYAPPTARATSSARTPASWCAGRERRAALRQPDRAAT